MEERDESHLVYIKCRQCQSAVLALVSLTNLGVSSVGLVTDLSSDDVIKFKSAEPISCDEVIEAHQFLSKNQVLIDQLNQQF